MKEEKQGTAIVWGAGGLGAALVRHLAEQGSHTEIICVSRQKPSDLQSDTTWLQADMLDEDSIKTAAAQIKAKGQVTLAIVATGMLHGDGVEPEKSMRAISKTNFETVFAVNTIGPSLIAKHVISLMPKKDRAVFAAISARVGSISDNRLGGWHAYRASKAALNMMLKGIAIEWGRNNPNAICVGLHPGTVDTNLSKPFQRGVPAEKLFSPSYSAQKLINVVQNLTPDQTGLVFDYAGIQVPA